MNSRASRRVIVVSAAALVLIAAALVIRSTLSRFVRNRLVAQVERHFDSTVEIEAVEVSVFPTVRVRGTDLELRRHDRRDVPPLVSVGTFSATTSLWYLWHGGIRRLDVTDLAIHVSSEGDRSQPAPHAAPDSTPPGPDEAPTSPVRGLFVDEIVSSHARLEIAPEDVDGTPLVFDIPHVRLRGFSPDGPAAYEARLTNPKPRGEIVSAGHFGPWQPGRPRVTPVSGRYTLTRADMSVFRGISGTLDSAGSFTGVLEAIAVSGQTTMPDFEVETGGHPMALHTTFDARVDGTNGNTYLDRVSARLAGSPIEATGEIAGAADTEGKTIRLDVAADAARLEDLIFLVVSADDAPMLGELRLRARLELPPGDTPVPDKLRVDGQFTIQRGRFASDAVQNKVDELSRRGRGEPKNASIDNVLSDFSGRFTLRDGRLRLPDLRFGVRGAEVRLAGGYALRGERLDFAGELRLQAKLSQTMTGFKSILLKVIDPFFSKHGAGAVLPIRVGGTVSKPEIGLKLFGG